MPRQLQQTDPFITGFTEVASIDEGGTGASSVEGAVQNLGGISRHLLGAPNGILQADERGFIPVAILKEVGFTVGYAIEGPASLTPGNVSVYRITNFNSLSDPTVSVSAGSVVLSGEELYVTAPYSGEEVILTVGERRIKIPIYPEGPIPPKIVYPEKRIRVHKRSTVIAQAFHSEPEKFSPWIVVDIDGGINVPVPYLASGVELVGRRGDGGAYLRTEAGTHQLGESLTHRRVFKVADSSFFFYRSGTAELKYRWIYPIARHVSTDWEIARDADFTDLVFTSYNDIENLTRCEVTLPEGQYFVRSRFNGLIDTGPVIPPPGGNPIQS